MDEEAGSIAGGPDVVAHAQLLLEAAETINSSLDSPALETTILGEATRLIGADASALLVSRGDVLVAQEVLGLSDRFRSHFLVPLETSVYGRAVVAGEILVEELAAGDAGAASVTGEGPWRTVMVAPLRSHRTTFGALSLFFAEARRFSDDEKAALRTLAIHAAIALDNRGLMQEKERLAVHDGLTDAFNRGYLEVALDRTGKDVRRNGGEVSILFVDVDGMKDVNDTYGHEAGDRLLIDLARLLNESCRESDVVARYGGDEFVVLMPATDVAGALRVTGKVEAAIAARNAAVGEAPHLSGQHRRLHGRGGGCRHAPARGRPSHVRGQARPGRRCGEAQPVRATGEVNPSPPSRPGAGLAASRVHSGVTGGRSAKGPRSHAPRSTAARRRLRRVPHPEPRGAGREPGDRAREQRLDRRRVHRVPQDGARPLVLHPDERAAALERGGEPGGAGGAEVSG